MICKQCTQPKTAHGFTLLRALKEEGIHITNPLYHSTSPNKIQSILTSGVRARAGGPHNDAYWGNAICLSRNLEFLKYTTPFGGGQVILVLDKAALQSKFKVHPYDWYEDKKHEEDASKRLLQKNYNFEYEERVTDKYRSPKDLRELKPKEIPDEIPEGYEDMFCLPKETVIPAKFIRAVVITQTAFHDSQHMWYEIDKHTPVIIRIGSKYEPLRVGKDKPYTFDTRTAKKLAGLLEGQLRMDGFYDHEEIEDEEYEEGNEDGIEPIGSVEAKASFYLPTNHIGPEEKALLTQAGSNRNVRWELNKFWELGYIDEIDLTGEDLYHEDDEDDDDDEDSEKEPIALEVYLKVSFSPEEWKKYKQKLPYDL